MGGKQKRFSKESKAKVAPEAIRGISTTAEIVSRHQVHPNQIAKWKKQLLENAASLFADGRSKTIKEDDGQLKDRLYQQIGQLQFELDWIKKNSETPIDAKRSLVEPQHERLSIARQCELLGMSRAAYYYEPWEWDKTALAMLRAIDEE